MKINEMKRFPETGQIFYLSIYDRDKAKVLVGIYKMIAGPEAYQPTVQKVELEFSNYEVWEMEINHETMVYKEDLKFIASTLKQAKKNLINRIFVGPFLGQN